MTRKSSKTSRASAKSTGPILVVEREYLPILLQLLDHATSSIDILAYSFAIGSTSRSAETKSAKAGAPLQIAQKLVERKNELGKKLKIRLYIEGRRDTSERNRVTGAFLKKAGIEVKYGSTHAKGFSIDGQYVLFGSTNLTNQSIMKNNETNLCLNDPAVVAGFGTYFDHLWRGGEHGGVELEPPMYADGAFKDVLLDMIDAAKSRLEFSIYFFHHSEIEEALIRAHVRGVKITGFIHDHFSFALSYVRRTHGTVHRLRDAGITDLHYGPNHLFTHSKYLIRDRKELALGTGNWLHEDVKVHPQLYIRLDDAKLAKQLASHLSQQIRAVAKIRRTGQGRV